jgi:GMP synthase (glutamine-hydrolysing)
MDRIAILDFGGQTTQLIGRRLRDGGYYAEIFPGDSSPDLWRKEDTKGVIFSGSPYSSYEKGSPAIHPESYTQGLPVLGICYGFQRMTSDHQGKVEPLATKEYGKTPLNYIENNPLFKGIPRGFNSWMSHGDSIAALGQGFTLLAQTHDHPAAAWHKEKRFWGIQFHPEASHCEYGNEILWNFAGVICGAKAEWTMEQYILDMGERIRQRVGDQKVLLLISGGVDSAVAGALLLKTLDPDQVHLMYIDTGMMRKAESDEVAKNLGELGAKHLYLIDARERFLGALAGISDPEKKRKIIGDKFIEVQEEEVKARNLDAGFLAQGTLYTDLIESGKGVGNKAKVIKSHHNVGTPLVQAKREAGLIIEPLEMLYKDEVRRLGELLGLKYDVVYRHPFPGPGLAIRIIGDVDKDKCDILREADYLYITELRKRDLYHKIWQAFAVLLPVKSVGVTGDDRNYGFVLALRAVVSLDGMTADVFDFPTKDLLEISNLITNKVKEIGRVVYDISSKPPSTIEWE